MKAVRWSAALLPILLALGACTTTGFGVGEVTSGAGAGRQVNFHWSSTNGGISGELSAAVVDSTYRGQFFQITQQIRNDVWLPQWPLAYGGWYPWPGWQHPSPHPYHYQPPSHYPYPGLYPYPSIQFSTFYTGTVLATLRAQNNQTMRCRFQLVDPGSGLSAGGEGSCELSTGGVVRAVLVGRER